MSEADASARRTVNIEDVGIARMYFSMLRNRFTGIMHITQPPPDAGARKVWFRGGMPIFTDWVSEPDALGELLVARKVISGSAFNEALSQVQSTGERMGQVLLGKGMLDAPKLGSALRLQCAQKLVHTFALREGEVVIDADAPVESPPELQGQVNVLQLIYRGVCAHFDVDRMRAAMGDAFEQKAIASKALTRYQSQFGFSREHAGILRSLMAGVELSALHAQKGEAAMHIAYCLWACQMLRVGAADAPAPRSRPAQKSAPRAAAAAPKSGPASASAASASATSARKSGPLPPPPGIQTPAGSKPPPPPSRPETSGPPPLEVNNANLPPDSDAPASIASGRLVASGPSSAPPKAAPSAPSSSPSSAPSKAQTAPPAEARSTRPERSRPPTVADPDVLAAFEAELDAFEKKMAAEANPFEIFGLEPGASRRDIRGVWADLSKHLHPDSLESRGLTALRDRAERVFAAVSEAYGVLSNKQERENLEAVLKMGGTGKVGEDASALVKNALEAEMLVREAERHVRAGKYARALDEYQRADKLNPDMPEIHAGLAYAEFAAGSHGGPAAGKALDALEAIVKENERLAIAHYFIGMVCVMSDGSMTRAATAFETAHGLNPRLVEAQRQLNAIRIRQRQAKEGKKKKKKGFGGLFGR